VNQEDTASPDPAFHLPARVTIVAGKGGTGKTTVTAALAYQAAVSGLRVLVVEVEGKSGLPALFDFPDPLTYEPTVLLEAGRAGPGSVTARTLTPDDALIEYLEDRGMRRISKRLTATGTLDVIATAVPGIKDILVLGKVKQIEQQIAAGVKGAPDCILVDAPAAGHAVTFLSSAYGLLEAAPVGPIRAQASDVVSLLSDPDRCKVMLVTLPEETPVNEAAETADRLRERVGVHLGPVVVNGLYPPLRGLDSAAELVADVPPDEAEALQAAAAFRRSRQELQQEQLGRLGEALDLPQLHLPYLFSPELGPADISALADALTEAVGALELAV